MTGCPFCAKPTVLMQQGNVLIFKCSDETCRTAANPIAQNEEQKGREIAALPGYPLAMSFDTKEQRDRFVKVLEDVRRSNQL
jgi:hypothetical protein